jgi:anion-transporting  ArsA/GET3 family ATPase
VVDTPPSRSALDFLDAPQRLSRFLDGRLIRLLTAPTRVSSRAYLKVVNAWVGMATGAVTKVLGTQLLRDVQTFVAALDTMFGGFRERAEDTYRLLQTPGTAFLVIATPEPDALREASYFVERLSQDRMPLAGLILNRVHPSPAARLSAARSLAAAEALQAAGADIDGTDGDGTDGDGTDGDGSHPAVHNAGGGVAADGPRHPLAVTALRLHAERMQLAAAERRLAQRFTAAHPAVPTVRVPAQPEDVHDLAGLRKIGESFAAS